MVALGGAESASAGTEYFCPTSAFGMSFSGYQTCAGPQHSLTDAQNYNASLANVRVCSGAFKNGAFYGSYFCADQSACHDYSGANILAPASHNGISGSQTIVSRESYGVDRLSPCPRGS